MLDPLARSDEVLVTGLTGYGSRRREIKVKVGSTYIVEPLNPKKIKHRGRKCVVIHLLGEYQNPNFFIVKARVKFLDNNKYGRVDITDLISY